MGRSWLLLWALAGPVLAPSAFAQNGPPVFAVLPFENSGSYGQDKEVFQALELGIPATIGATIASHPGARLADEGRVRQALGSHHLAASQHVDAATAAQIAKAAGARYTVTGSFADFYGKLRITSRLVDADDGRIIAVASNNDPKLQSRAQLAAIIQYITERMIGAAGLPPFPGTTAAHAAAVPTDALNQYSRGLLFESQGDKGKASDSYRRALSVFPDYTQAREGLQRVGGS